MKLSKEVVSLPVICISDGKEIGTVKSLIVNNEKGSIDFLTINHEDMEFNVKAIPFKKVIGIGEYAVTIESENSILNLTEIPVANELITRNVKIINTKVMTRFGKLLGDVYEFVIDEATGAIVAILLNVNEKQVVLDVENVITYGKDLIVVSEKAEDNFLTSMNELGGEQQTEELEGQLENIAQKQIDLLVGKKVQKDIVDEKGEVIIAENQVLTETDITKARNAGSHVLIEVSMNAVTE
ncbi:MAG TPA: PRC-barrel domain-containing protein [Massilibacterium sp.]|nr:PRC-barrel domain-containing protein [Massilibacterium sp.]